MKHPRVLGPLIHVMCIDLDKYYIGRNHPCACMRHKVIIAWKDPLYGRGKGWPTKLGNENVQESVAMFILVQVLTLSL